MAHERLIQKALRDPGILRAKRKRAFQAFDIYKSNVEYGVITETEQEHEAIMRWYLSCLELDQSAIENIPDKVGRYMK